MDIANEWGIAAPTVRAPGQAVLTSQPYFPLGVQQFTAVDGSTVIAGAEQGAALIVLFPVGSRGWSIRRGTAPVGRGQIVPGSSVQPASLRLMLNGATGY